MVDYHILCRQCQVPLTSENATPSRIRKRTYYCRKCYREKRKSYDQPYQKEYRKRKRREQGIGPRVYPPITKCCVCSVTLTPENISPSRIKHHTYRCHSCQTQYTRNWHKAHPHRHRERLEERMRDPAEKEKIIAQRKARRKREYLKRGITISGKIESSLRGRLYKAIVAQTTSKTAHTSDLVGCSIAEVIKHLESLWSSGMTWENYGAYRKGKPMTWNVDHIKPIASFDLTDPEQQKQCFHWSNLQPLWAIDNIQKRDKIIKVNYYSLDSTGSKIGPAQCEPCALQQKSTSSSSIPH